MRSGWLLLLVSLAALPSTAVRCAGQASYGSAFVPLDHWSVRAAARLAGLGLGPAGHDIARRTPTQRELGEFFEHAVEEAERGSPRFALARAIRERYARDFSRDVDRRTIGYLRGSELNATYLNHAGVHETGFGYEDGHVYGDWTGAARVPDQAGGVLEAAIQLTPVDWAAVRAEAAWDETGATLESGYGAVRAGHLVLWGGRRTLGWSPSASSGLVMRDLTIDGVGLQTDRPFRLPWILRHVGPIHLDVTVGRKDLPRTCHDPHRPGAAVPCEGAYFLATRGTIAPHRRFTVGVSRAAFFGGAGNTDVDAFGVLSILIGKHAGVVSELDNQVVSVDASYRPPIERWLPVRAYLEWGFEDSAGAFASVPGLLLGIEVPSIPELEQVGIGLERTSFARSCCGNPIWYRHQVFHDGWTIEGRPIAHPLGGHGSEWLLRADWLGPEARASLVGEAFVRDRGLENVWAEAREGRSRGASLRAALWILEQVEGNGSVSVEDGEDWRETRATLGVRVIL